MQESISRFSSWNYYGNLKPMLLLLTSMGLFSPVRNPMASTMLKGITLTYCFIRFFFHLTLCGIFIAPIFGKGIYDLPTYMEAVILGLYHLINVTFVLLFNFSRHKVSLLDAINNLGNLKERTRFYFMFLIYMVCVTIETVRYFVFLVDESQRQVSNARYPFHDHNSVAFFVTTAISLILMPAEEGFVAMYYSYVVLVIYLGYKKFNREFESATTEGSISNLGEYRKKYMQLQKIVSDFTCAFSFYILFNLTIWLFMFCATSYLSIVTSDVYLFSTNFNVMTMMVMFTLTSSLVYAEVSHLLLSKVLVGPPCYFATRCKPTIMAGCAA